ncbi:MAG: YbdD/YjiX family protein [Gemmatimonadaceae bacterium]|nr:YbdD/YjiX family protein [Gemmatimonadaceae bacterium]
MKTFLLRVASIVRRVIGAPDYEHYLAHFHANHPGKAPLSRPEFIREGLAARYSRPGARCC